MRLSIALSLLVMVGCAATHPQLADADVDAPLGVDAAVAPGATLAEGLKTCASDDDCNAAWPACRCDARCWAHDAPGAPAHGAAPRTVAYLVGGLRIVEDVGATSAFGLDLDATTGGAAGTCTGASDFVSPFGPDPGVDNQLQAFLHYGEHVDAYQHYGDPSGSIGGSTLDGMVTGIRGWMIEVSDIDSFEDDCFVSIRLTVIGTETYETPLALGTACPVHVDETGCLADEAHACVWSPSTSACRGIAGGQAVRIIAVSGTGTGRIGGGVLRTGPIGQTQLELVEPMLNGEFATQIYETRIEARIDENALTHGQLGGSVPMDALAIFAGWLSIAGGPTFTPAELEARVQPDLAPDATGHCTAVSAGFAFGALAVHVLP